MSSVPRSLHQKDHFTLSKSNSCSVVTRKTKPIPVTQEIKRWCDLMTKRFSGNLPMVDFIRNIVHLMRNSGEQILSPWQVFTFLLYLDHQQEFRQYYTLTEKEKELLLIQNPEVREEEFHLYYNNLTWDDIEPNLSDTLLFFQ